MGLITHNVNFAKGAVKQLRQQYPARRKGAQCRVLRFLLHGDALGQVPGLVDVAAPLQGDVVRQQLQGGHPQLG